MFQQMSEVGAPANESYVRTSKPIDTADQCDEQKLVATGPLSLDLA
jgi:hypothetical protein